MLKNTLKLSGILCAISLVTALLLALTNELTADIIARRQLEAKNSAMASVIDAGTYNLLASVPDGYELYAAFNDNTLEGYAVSLTESGYGGDIDMMIGIDTDFKVTGISIIEMTETPGLGDNAKNPEFTGMFKGLSGEEVALTSDGGKIQALSGATVTSKAVTGGVQRALEIVAMNVDGGASNE